MSGEIILKFENQRLVLVPLGGGIKNYYLQDGLERYDLVAGYEDESDKSGSMGDVLFPFPGRIENSQYEFEGQTYTLSGLKQKDGHAIHGFAKLAEWQVVHEAEDNVILSFTLLKNEYEAKGFPFSLNITLHYSLAESGLACKATVKNLGENNAPFGLGFHPYFTLGGKKVDELKLKVSAQKLVEFDQSLKPTGKYIDVAASHLDFSTARLIGQTVIDNCFTELDYSQDGINKTELSDGEGGKLIIWQDRNLPYLQLYSADTIAAEKRRCGLAVEAQTCTGFVLNKPEMGLKILAPGQIFEANWGAGFVKHGA